MAIPSRQIGWGTEENLLWEISKQLEALTGVAYNSGGSGTGGTGTSGTTGTSGSSGVSGTAGSSGTSAMGGTSGIDGTNGVNGADGTSGVDGNTGTSGTAGISGDHFSSTSGNELTIAESGSLSFTIETGLSWTVAQQMIVAYDSSNYMIVVIDSYDIYTGAVTATIDSNFGSGTYSSWAINTVGAPGLSGTAGTSGSSGLTGTSGIDGTFGSSGESGTSGTSGSSGESGTAGSSGTSALDGSSGTSGSSGLAGTSGISGTSGRDATAGTSGVSGTNGVSGTAGTSGSSGLTGSSGTSAAAGTAGTSGTSPGSAVSTVRLFISAARSNANVFLFNSITVTSDSSAAPAADTAFMVTSPLTTVKVYLRDTIASNNARIDIFKNANGTDFSTATSIANATSIITANTVTTYTFTGLSISAFDSIHVQVTPGTGGTNKYYGIVTIE